MRPVLCMGEALIDFQPAVAGDADGLFRRYAGGAPANVAVAVARLGGRAEFLGMLGEDAFGDFLLEELRAAGVGTAGVQRTADAPTALAFVNLDARGERSFSFYRDRAADLLFRADAIPPQVFEGAAILHACSNSLVEADIAEATFACMRRAREAGALVGFDMNLRPALWAPGVDPAPRLWRALALADVVKLCVDEFDFAAGPSGDHEAMIARLWRGATRLLVVTDGDRVLRWFAPDGRGELPPFVVRAVDNPAAGVYPDGVAWTETMHTSGRTDYAERGERRAGDWNFNDAGELCFRYDHNKGGGCFRYVRLGANCYEHFVEIGPREAVFSNPRHPYTRKLLAAVPVPDPGRRALRRELAVDELPSPVRALGWRAEPTALIEVGPGHFTRQAEARA